MGNSCCCFGAQAKSLPASTKRWQRDPCFRYSPLQGDISVNSLPQELWTIPEDASVDIKQSNKLHLPDSGPKGTCATTIDSALGKKDARPGHLRIPLWAMSTDPYIALRIPEEIWKMVAANMSAADWARVSCTSRALSRVQLETLSLEPQCSAGILWAAAHWQEAKIFALTVRGWDNQELVQFSEVLEAAHTAGNQNKATAMQHVRNVAVHLEAGSSICDRFNLWHILSASHTPRLETLCIVTDRTVRFGSSDPLPHLKHLRLEVKHQDQLYIIEYHVRTLPNLETLTICSDITNMKVWDCWKLNVVELENLRCINLHMVTPQSLKVPPGCQVHFVCHNISDASQVWDKGLGAACTSCHLIEVHSSEEAAEPSSLTKCLQHIVKFSCPHLTVLKLNCSAVGSMEEPLLIGTCLPALRELEIQTLQGLHLWVGAGLCLHSLTTCSEDLLQVEMEDMNHLLLTSGLKRFRYAYNRCCMVTHMLLWHFGQLRNWVSNENTDDSTEMHEAGALQYSGVALETAGCRDHTCGTCIDCLRRKHLPVSDNAEWPFVGLFAQPE